MKRENKIIKSSGFSYIEILIAMFIFITVAIAVVGSFITYLMLVEDSKNISIAVNDAQNVLEQMRNLDPFSSATTQFPGGAAVLGFNNLNSEQVVVDYTNPAADPLDITITVNWSGWGGRQQSISLATKMTQR